MTICETLYLVWSFEHDAWWKPNERGYTRDVLEAGQYPLEQARRIVEMANYHLPKKMMPYETLIPAHAVVPQFAANAVPNASGPLSASEE